MRMTIEKRAADAGAESTEARPRDRANLLACLHVQAYGCARAGSPFYAALLELELRFGFEAAEFPEPMAQAIEKLVFAESEPPSVVPDRLGLAVTMLRLIRHKLPPAEFARKSREALESGIRNATETMRQYHEWWPKYVRTMRVCCVAEEHDNLLMWSHYAEQHKGVVIQLKCIPELDTALCAAKAVTYRPDVPVMAGLDEYIKHCTGERRLTFDNLFFDMAFAKSAHWSYEREWRCWVLARPGEQDQLYEDNLLYPEEIDSIYLGLRIADENRDAILGTLSGKLDHVKLFRARLGKRRFGLDFERIK